jgi:membrane protein required for colicin V production
MLPSGPHHAQPEGASKGMNPLDIALIALLAIPAVLGLWKGLANVVTVLVGIWAAFLLAPLVKQLLAPWIGRFVSDEGLTAVLAYGIGFIGVLLVVGILGWLVTRSLKKLDLQWANRLAGMALGALCGLLFGGVLVATLEALHPEAEVFADSVLAAPLGTATRFLVALGPVEKAREAAQAPNPNAPPPEPPAEALGPKPEGDAAQETPPPG